MPALITSLIDKTDNVELVRDQIAAILVLESTNQAALALAAGKQQRLWKLRVFQERSAPWSYFEEDPEKSLDLDTRERIPIVSVALDSATIDPSRSNTVERQLTKAVYHIDCYGFGVSQATGGHTAGDEDAALEAQRAMRWVRNILMSGHYTYLGMRGIVSYRMPQSFQMLQPQIDSRPVQRVMGCRLQFEVHVDELSPQLTAQNLEYIAIEIRKDTVTGQLLLQADFDHS